MPHGIRGAVEIAEQTVERARENLAAAQERGKLLDRLEAEHGLKYATDVLESVRAAELEEQARLADPERLGALDQLDKLTGPEADNIRAAVGQAVDRLLCLAPIVEQHNAALRSAVDRARRNEPGYVVGHPAHNRHQQELDLERLVVESLRRGRSR